nr:MAG TPA: hypothetical protein [Caudoviricetes sp.]
MQVLGEMAATRAVSRRTEGRRTKVRRPRNNEDNAPLPRFPELEPKESEQP